MAKARLTDQTKTSRPARTPAQRVMSGPLTMYRQIEAILRDQISSGELASGDRIPTEAELSELYKVSRPTVRQALQQLEQENLIFRERGRGTFVHAVPQSRSPGRHLLSLRNFDEPNRSIQISILRKGTIKPQSAIHEALKLPQSSEISFYIRIFSLGGETIGGEKIHIPTPLTHALRPADLAMHNISRTIASRNKLTITRSDQFLDAILAEARIAESLNTRPGTPLIAVRRISYDHRQFPFESSQTLFRSDKCYFGLPRPSDGGK